MAREITRAQALAFMESLVGYDKGRLKSPHAVTHLAAVLGYEKVPWIRTVIDSLAKDQEEGVYKDDRVLMDSFIEYLEAVVARLKEREIWR